MELTGETRSVKNFFQTINVHISDLWLKSCVNWYHEQNPEKRFNEQELREKVFGQWLLLDLRDAEMPCLPENLASHKTFELKGAYCLQMLYVVDISKPKYLQLQKIQNTAATTSLEQFKEKEYTDSKRMLQLTLTDGVQEIDAIEYVPISVLNINMTPGVKIRITGPLTVRRGKILLTSEQSVKVLGGEVEEILVSNAVENVLARGLGIQENPKPRIQDIVSLPAQKDEIIGQTIPKDPLRSTNQQDGLQLASSVQTDVRGNKTRNCRNKSNIFEDDFDISLIDLENIERQQASNTPNLLREPDCLDNLEDNEIFENIDVDLHTAVNLNRVYNLKEIRTFTDGVYNVQARYKEIVQKLKVVDGKWTMKIIIVDDTDECTVDLSSNVATKLVGYNPCELMALKEESVALEILANFKEKILHLNCLMDVEVKGLDIRTIISIE